jgi:hypothetical protein
MGLDMYLSATRYVSPYKHNVEERKLGNEIAKAAGLPVQENEDTEDGRVEGVSVRVGYWRKANAIHQWFIDHCASGVDDCRPVNVMREQLEELKALCEKVTANPTAEVAAETLPSQGGFFFGSTEYDEWYFESVKETIEIIDRALALANDEKAPWWDFEYRASW